jgi:hypothetical protein
LATRADRIEFADNSGTVSSPTAGLMHFLKSLLRFVLILILFSIIVSVAGWFMLRGTPTWYRPDLMTPDQRKAAAARVEDKLIHMYNWVNATRARRVLAVAAAKKAPPSTPSAAVDFLNHEPAQPFQISFTEAELNAFFDKWADAADRRAVLAQYVQDPRLVLRDKQIILAGTLKDLGLVVSMEFEPSIDDQSNLQMNLTRVVGGVLPLPDIIWARRRKQILNLLTQKLPTLQRKATIAPDGTASPAAAEAAMNKLLQATFTRQSADPAIFLPYDMSHPDRCVPVTVSAVSILNDTLTLTVQQMTAPQRQALIERLRTPLTPPTGPTP